jgi:hypothetical protein
MADGDLRSTPLHPGVDPQSWMGFERRVQARRYDALINSARAALAERNDVLAAHALDEARELRADGPELLELQAAIDRMAMPPGSQRQLWRRGASAAALLLCGTSLFVWLDASRITRDALPLIAPVAPSVLSAVPVARQAVPYPPSIQSVGATAFAVPPEDAALTLVRMPRVEPVTRVPSLPRTAELTPAAAGAAEVALPAAVEHDDERPARASDDPPMAAISVAPVAPMPVPAMVVTPVRRPAVSDAAMKVVAGPDERTRVADVLQRYARAYGELDVRAAREVWPGVDQRALTRAFDGLSSQSVSFDDCQIDVQGSTANASCRGQASYIGKVGRSVPRIEARTWRFELRRDGEAWKIENAEARRSSGS